MKKPDLSFVIPAYNAEAYLAFSIGSCLAQSHKNIEVIVINDGSTDSTRRLADFYAKDERVRVIHLEINFGRGSARNTGNSKAEAPYIAVLDADDESTADRAKVTLEMFKKYGDALIYGSRVNLDCLSQNMGALLASEFDKEKATKELVNYITHSTMAYPKSWWEKHPYDEGEFSELGLDDWKFQTEAALSGIQLKHTEKILCGYRITRSGISRNRDEKKVREIKEKFLKAHGIETKEVVAA